MLKKFFILVLITTIHSALLAQTATPTLQKTHYTCVIHPEVMQDHPGNCPKCGMELAPVEEEKKRPTPNTQQRGGSPYRPFRTFQPVGQFGSIDTTCDASS